MAGKILESLILSCFNSYIKHRKLIPCVQTGFREGMSTSINLKRMYNKIYTRSVHATYPDPTIMIFFDTKKFSTVSGMLGFCVKPLARACRLSLSGSLSWLTGRTLQVRIGQTLSKIVRLQSGVPQGSVLALFIWNYFTGDIPTTISPHSDTAVYADDTSLAATHKNLTLYNTLYKKKLSS